MGDAKVWINKGNRDWTLDELVAAFERHGAWRDRAEKAEREVSALTATIKVNEQDHAAMVRRLEANLAKVENERNAYRSELAKVQQELVASSEALEQSKEAYRMVNRERNESDILRNRAIAACEKMRGERDEADKRWRLLTAYCKSCEGPLACAKCAGYAGSANAAEDRKVTSPHDGRACISVDVDHEARIIALEKKLDGIAPAAFGPRYAGHCPDCGIGPAGAHLAGCSRT